MGIWRAIKRVFGFGKAKSRKQKRLSLAETINRERERLLLDDTDLNVAMKLVAGVRPDRASMNAAIAGGHFGNAFGRTLNASYDAAQTNRDNQSHWAASDALAADAANSPYIRRILRNRSRYEIANNCYANGIGQSKAADLVGAGPRLHIDDPRLTVEQRADVEAKFTAWTRAVRLAEKLRTMRKARRQDGEVFASHYTRDNLTHPVKLDLRLIEAEQVASPPGFMPDARHVDGIDLDENGNPENYHVLKGHPGDPAQMQESLTELPLIPAARMIHWFRQDRPAQHRGLPETTASLPLYALSRRYDLAVVQAAETGADFAMWMKTPLTAADVSDDEVLDGGTVGEQFSLQRNIVTTLPDGYDIGQTKQEQPTNTHDPFTRALIRQIARNECVPLNVALGDSSAGNFASGNLDYRIYYRPLEIERDELEIIALDPLWAAWLAEAVLIEGYLPPQMRTLTDGVQIQVSHSWHWDSNELGDPLKLAGAKGLALKNGLTTIPELYAARNQDWRQAFAAGAAALDVTVPEFQEMVRDSIFAGSADPATGDDEESPPPTGNSTRQQPQQQAARTANGR